MIILDSVYKGSLYLKDDLECRWWLIIFIVGIIWKKGRK